MAKVDDLMKLDLYGLFDLSPNATEKEILSSYRKKARKCHPDKNPDNPKAVELFQQLSKALEVLTDAAARAAYNKVLKARQAAEERNRQLNSQRKKLKEDLEARERSSFDETGQARAAAKNLEREIERLRKQGSSLLEEEQERMREDLARSAAEAQEKSDEPPRLKVRWKAKKDDESNGGYDQELLMKNFSKYGEVVALIISSKKRGSAIVEFKSPLAATMAAENELGVLSNPLSYTWVSGAPAHCSPPAPPPHIPPCDLGGVAAPHVPAQEERDFEDLVLMRLRHAEERKRLTAQMQQEDEEEQQGQT